MSAASFSMKVLGSKTALVVPSRNGWRKKYTTFPCESNAKTERLFGMGDIQPMSLGLVPEKGLLVATCTYYPRLLRFDLNKDPADSGARGGASAFGKVWVFSEKDVVVGPGGGGKAARFLGGDWTASAQWASLEVPEGFDRHWNDVWSPGRSRLWIVGPTPGRVLGLDGDVWSVEGLPLEREFLSVWGEGERAVIVGRQGALCNRTKNEWTVLEGPLDADMTLARGTAKGEVYICGEERTLLRLTWAN